MLLDTSIAIPLRDGDVDVRARVARSDEQLLLSVISVVELKAGLTGPESPVREATLSLMLREIEVLGFGLAEADAYGAIVQAVGFSRSKVLDRMIAAQDIVADATLAT
ncbi:MAG TPA: VapC toxin family PIN domain ribonuclease, partial [Brevundimonas sp.]|nr:VapC toxin family PIN domain ribonuclease [Brevundimonas sp.]